MNGATFLREVVEVFPDTIHTVLTDNSLPRTRSGGMAFADLPKYRDGPTARWMGHIFDRVCREHGIEHRLTRDSGAVAPSIPGRTARPSG